MGILAKRNFSKLAEWAIIVPVVSALFTIAPTAQAQSLQTSFLTAAQLIASGGASGSSCVEFPASSGMFFVAVSFTGSDTFVSTTACDPATFVSSIGGTGSGLAGDLDNTADFLLNGFQNFENVLGAVQAHLDKSVVPDEGGIDGGFPDLQPGQVDDEGSGNRNPPVGVFDKAIRIKELQAEIAELEQELKDLKKANAADEEDRQAFLRNRNHPLNVKIRELSNQVNQRINDSLGNEDHNTLEHIRAGDRLRETDPEFRKLYNSLDALEIERTVLLDTTLDNQLVRDMENKIQARKDELERLLNPQQANSTSQSDGSLDSASTNSALAYQVPIADHGQNVLIPLQTQSNTQGFLLDLDALFRRDQTEKSRQSPWNFWLQGSLTVFDDNQAADRDGQYLQLIGGTSYRINERYTVGGLLTYNNGNVNSNALSSGLNSNFVGAGLFARANILEGIQLDTLLNYQHGWNDITIAGASGDFGSDSINVAASLSKRFYFRPDWWLEPNAGISYSNVHRSTYTDSAGTTVSGSNVEQGRFTFGPKIGHIFAPTSGALSQGEVFVGLNGVVDFLSNGDSSVGNGLVASYPGSGIQVSGGLNLTFDNGWNASASGSYMSVGTLDSYTTSVKLTIPLN